MNAAAGRLALASALLFAPFPLRGEEAAILSFGAFAPFSGPVSAVYGPGLGLSIRSVRGERLRLFGQMDVLYVDGYGSLDVSPDGGAPELYLTRLSGVVARASYVEAHNREAPVEGVGWTELDAQLLLVPAVLGVELRLLDGASLQADLFAACGPVVGLERVEGSYRDNAKQSARVGNQVALAGAEARAGVRLEIPISGHWHGAFELSGSSGRTRAAIGGGHLSTHRVDLRGGFSFHPPPPTPTPRLAGALSPTPTVVPLSESAPAMPTPTAGPKR